MDFKRTVGKGGIELHMHSSRSDGRLSLKELLDMALEMGLSTIAVTDHNAFPPEILELQPIYQEKGLEILTGTELTTLYYLKEHEDETEKKNKYKSKRKQEVHIVGINFDPEKMKPAFSRYLLNRRPYVEAVLARLREDGVADIKYEEMEQHFDSLSMGKMHIARELVMRGVSADVYEALDDYVGSLGSRKCYVDSSEYLDIPNMEDAVAAILEAGGIPVLAHPFYYGGLSEEEIEELIAYFKSLAGDKAAMEVYYRDYSKEQTEKLVAWAEKYQIRTSAGSDYHGYHPDDHLRGFDPEILDSLLPERKKKKEC